MQAQRNAGSDQRGSVAILVASAVLLAMVLLGAVQVGYVAYVKRDLQKMVDMAALSGVQVLGAGDEADCTQAVSVAEVLADKNAETISLGSMHIDCGMWMDANRTFSPQQAGEIANAVRVRVVDYSVTRVVPFVGDNQLTVEAIASVSQPTVDFSVAPRLLRMKSDGLLGYTLAAVGVQPSDITVLDSEGLLNATVTPAGLLDALKLPVSVAAGIGTPEQLARLENLKLSELLDVTAAVLSQSDELDVEAGLLRTFLAKIEGTPLDSVVNLLGSNGIIRLATGPENQDTALDSTISVQHLLGAGILMANGENLLDIGADVSQLGVTTRLRVVEPPSVSLGATIGTKISSAALRLYVHVDSSQSLVGALLSPLSVKVDLPLIVEVAQADATIMDLCWDPVAPQARVRVNVAPVNVCIGRFNTMSVGQTVPEVFFSRETSCTAETMTSVQPHKVLDVLGLLPAVGPIALPVLPSGPVNVVMAENEKRIVSASGLPLGTTLASVVNTVLFDVVSRLLGTSVPLSTSQGTQLATALVGTGGKGQRSVSQAIFEVAESRNRLDAWSDRLAEDGLLGLVGGTVGFIGDVLNLVLLAPASDTVCALAIIDSKIRECRIDAVRTLAFSGNGAMAGIATIVENLLKPVLNGLGDVVSQVLDVLGIKLGEAEVSVGDINCRGQSIRLVH